MSDFFSQSEFFGTVITLTAFGFGTVIRQRFYRSRLNLLLNPLLIAAAIVIIALALFNVDYTNYLDSAKPISFLLTPATVCLAVPLYEQFWLLKRHGKALLLGISCGTAVSAASVIALSLLFSLERSDIFTLLPKSVTTAIGIGISSELGGFVPLTTAAILFSGIIGSIAAPAFCRALHITEPAAVGAAIGTSSHAIGTAKALEIGKIEGAVSSLSIVVSGVLTVILAGILDIFL